MKYLTLTILISLFTISISAQTNRVGIGTTNPGRLLHLEGDLNSNDNLIYSKVNRVGLYDIRAIETYSIPNPGYGIGGHFTGGFRGVHAFNDGQDYGGIPTYGLYAQSTGTAGTRIGLYAEATGGATNLAAKFGGGDVEIVNDLRIGTTAQNGRLHVKNINQAFGGSAPAIRVESIHNASQPNYGMYATGENSGSGASYGLRAEGNVTGSGDSYGVRALAYANGTGGVAYGLHSAVDAAQGWSLYSIGKNYMSGDLRIGTVSDPYNGEYKVIVDGKILSEEVRIQNSSLWPDYVFEESYPLMPLDELAQSIQEYGHLPNIPPAEVVEREGIQVGDMQVRMMEKIEELTLYILQQQKEIDTLKHQLNQLTGQN